MQPLPQTIDDGVARLQAAVITVDAKKVSVNAVRRTAVYLKMGGGRFEHLLQLRAPI
jgi:hypothetical protein